MFICEGETDTMRLWQELRDNGKTAEVVGLPGISAWRPEYAKLFENAREVIVIVDNDSDYGVQAQVESSWLMLRRDLGPKARRLRLPGNVKDVCEYFKQAFDLDDLRSLITAPISRYNPLDLTDPGIARPVDWLVEGLMGKGWIGIAFGEPGSGKSWLSLSLAIAVLQGWDKWLGLPLQAQGKVLYIDEENPEDVILARLNQLGLRNQDLPNLRFLHEQNIRLDRDPSAVLDEALGFDPTLIVVDALTRIHTKNENDAGEMSALFNDGLKPLARQTGATVLVLHHANKVTDGNSYRRMRGSVDIGAAYDLALEVQATAPQMMAVKHFKTRRGKLLPPINVQILDTDEGGRTFTRLVSNIEAPPPF